MTTTATTVGTVIFSAESTCPGIRHHPAERARGGNGLKGHTRERQILTLAHIHSYLEVCAVAIQYYLRRCVRLVDFNMCHKLKLFLCLHPEIKNYLG